MNRLQWKDWYREQRIAKKEEWKDIPGYEGNYQVSNLGKVKSFNYMNSGNIKVLTPYLGKYKRYALSKNNIRTTLSEHRLIALAFVPNPENKPQINHKNGIKYDNRIKNLEWCNNSENQIHAYRYLGKKGGKKGKKVIQYNREGNKIMEFSSLTIASKETKISQGNISLSCLGIRSHAGGYIWKYK